MSVCLSVYLCIHMPILGTFHFEIESINYPFASISLYLIEWVFFTWRDLKCMSTRLFLNICGGSCESVTQRIIVCSVNPSEGVRTVKNSILHWLWHKFVPAAHRASPPMVKLLPLNLGSLLSESASDCSWCIFRNFGLQWTTVFGLSVILLFVWFAFFIYF